MTAAPPPARPARAPPPAPPPRRPASGRPGGRPPGADRSVRRLRAGRVALVALLAVTGLKLVAVQTVQAGTLTEGAERQRTTEIALPAGRGTILDRDGNLLAF